MFDPLGKARNWPGTTIEPKPEKHERFDYSASALERTNDLLFRMTSEISKDWILDFCMRYLTWKAELRLPRYCGPFKGLPT